MGLLLSFNSNLGFITDDILIDSGSYYTFNFVIPPN